MARVPDQTRARCGPRAAHPLRALQSTTTYHLSRSGLRKDEGDANQDTARTRRELRGDLFIERKHAACEASSIAAAASFGLLVPMPSLENETVAAVIPVRNRPEALRRAVASALAQTLPLSEIVIVDDGSTDRTREVAEEFARSHSRISCLSQPEQRGAGAARNRGVANCTSKWVAFLDSDDAWEPSKLHRQVSILGDRPEAVASFTGRRNVSQTQFWDDAIPAQVGLLDLQMSNVVGTTSSAVVRRDAFDRAGGFDPLLPSCQDWDLYLRLIEQGPFVCIPDPLVLFTADGQDRITKNIDAVLRGHEAMRERILSSVTSPRHRRLIAASHLTRLSQIYLWDAGSSRKALGYAMRSLLVRPTFEGLRLTRLSVRRLGLRLKSLIDTDVTARRADQRA